MPYRLVTLLIIAVLLGACRQDVGFAPAEGQEAASVLPPVEITEPNPPIVKILQAPKDSKLDESNPVLFEVLRGDFDIATVTCSIGGKLVDCDAEKGWMDANMSTSGRQELEIVATDVEGLSGQARENWLVSDRFRRFRDRLRVQDRLKKTDILFVIDNSGSMYAEQLRISERFSDFIDKIENLDWHIAITTTDPRSHVSWGDGKIDPFSNGDYFLTPKLGAEKAQELFSKHVRRTESGWDTEMGILATYRSIERAGRSDSQVDKKLARFFRRDAALAVVVVSDEDESESGFKNDGDNLISLVEQKWGRNKTFQFNSIIVHTQQCLWGEGAQMGVEYERLSRKTNGIIGDVCARNYSDILKSLGEGVSNLEKVHNLKCDPQDIDNDGQIDLVISSRDGSAIPGYTIDERRIEFDQALNPDQYEFRYYCLN
ncbi:MAG: hypothetical protein AAF203_02365 [Pseudomonadota bacterium]